MSIRHMMRRVKSAALTREFWRLDARVRDVDHRVRLMQEALGRIESRQCGLPAPHEGLAAAEFRVHSQWGEDGIIQHLVHAVPIERRLFVEFGVESYEEANTRFLLVNNGWAGLILDSDPRQVDRIRSSEIYWLHNLKVACAMITRGNINALLEEHGMIGSIGLLSIDIDGMDYWIWDAINIIEPAIVVIEYNHRFGPELSVTVPYEDTFDRRTAHSSLNYYGASLRALARLGQQKGYALVGVGSAGLNAFFVKRSLRPPSLPEIPVEQAYRRGGFCETHDEEGHRIRTTWDEEHALVTSLPLVTIDDVPE